MSLAYRAVVPAGHGFRRRASFLPRFCPYRDMGSVCWHCPYRAFVPAGHRSVGGRCSCQGVASMGTRAFGERVGNRHDGKKAPQGLKLGRNARAGSPNVPQGRKIGRKMIPGIDNVPWGRKLGAVLTARFPNVPQGRKVGGEMISR